MGLKRIRGDRHFTNSYIEKGRIIVILNKENLSYKENNDMQSR